MSKPFRVILYPSQIRLAESLGYVRDKDFTVYACLKCLKDMDRCSCRRDRQMAREARQ